MSRMMMMMMMGDTDCFITYHLLSSLALAKGPMNGTWR